VWGETHWRKKVFKRRVFLGARRGKCHHSLGKISLVGEETFIKERRTSSN